MPSEVKFWVLLNNKILRISAQLEDTLVDLFIHLQNNAEAAEYIPAKLASGSCQFYRLKAPVLVVQDDEGDSDDFLEQAKKACLEESNMEYMNPIPTRVCRLAEEFSTDHVHLVIKFPDAFRESSKAIGSLRENHGTLFQCLQVRVQNLRKWRLRDVVTNLRGGVLVDDDNHPEFREIQEALAKPRLYQEYADAKSFQVVDEQERDRETAGSYKTQFDRVFALAGTESNTVLSGREFAAFYNVLRCFNEDVERIITASSPSFKASNFTVHFIQPPFFSEDNDPRGFKYHQEKVWDFPIFVDIQSARSAWRKFTPRSDWMVISRDFKIPFVISEVISQKNESDRFRMLVEAIALARTGQYLLKSTSKRRFFVVAIYVDARMVVSRYLVMQTGDTENKPVSIHRKDFNLADTEQEINFLREMYNLATQITALSRDFDQARRTRLSDVQVAAKKVLSLSSTHQPTKTSGSTTMDSITEGHAGAGGPEDEDDLGVFEAEDIQNILHQMNYKIEFIPWGHPQLAVIVNKTGDKHGYLKLVEREKEIQVLQYLAEIESPSNHTISDVRFWPVQGGTMISMPVGGGWLTSLDHPSKHVWSVALQLFEAVAFMQEHNVAHMDLKPQNVIVPSEGGRLSIIDFSVSIRVQGPDVKYTGVVGTEDYMAPEVREGEYKPILADLWSCGRTLEELCSCCESSADRTRLLELARRLMNRDPEARPKMSTVLEWIAPAQRGEDNVASSTLQHLPTISPLCA